MITDSQSGSSCIQVHWAFQFDTICEAEMELQDHSNPFIIILCCASGFALYFTTMPLTALLASMWNLLKMPWTNWKSQQHHLTSQLLIIATCENKSLLFFLCKLMINYHLVVPFRGLHLLWWRFLTLRRLCLAFICDLIQAFYGS